MCGIAPVLVGSSSELIRRWDRRRWSLSRHEVVASITSTLRFRGVRRVVDWVRCTRPPRTRLTRTPSRHGPHPFGTAMWSEPGCRRHSSAGPGCVLSHRQAGSACWTPRRVRGPRELAADTHSPTALPRCRVHRATSRLRTDHPETGRYPQPREGAAGRVTTTVIPAPVHTKRAGGRPRGAISGGGRRTMSDRSLHDPDQGPGVPRPSIV